MGLIKSKPKIITKTKFKILILIKENDDIKIIDILDTDEKTMLKTINNIKHLPKIKDDHIFPKKHNI